MTLLRGGASSVYQVLRNRSWLGSTYTKSVNHRPGADESYKACRFSVVLILLHVIGGGTGYTSSLSIHYSHFAGVLHGGPPVRYLVNSKCLPTTSKPTSWVSQGRGTHPCRQAVVPLVLGGELNRLIVRAHTLCFPAHTRICLEQSLPIPRQMESDTKTCPECGRTFTTLSGKSLHMKSAHPVAYNEYVAERARTGRDKRPRPPPPSGVIRARWTRDEDRLMAQYEVNCPKTSNINLDISGLVLPHRSQIAVNSRRRTVAYRKLLEEVRLEGGQMSPPPPQPPQARPAPESAPAAESREAFYERILRVYGGINNMAGNPADPDDSPSDSDESVSGESSYSTAEEPTPPRNSSAGESSDSDAEEPTPPRRNRVGGGNGEGDEEGEAVDPLSRLGEVYVPERVREMEAHSTDACSRIRDYATQLAEAHGLGVQIPNSMEEVMQIIRDWVGDPPDPRQGQRERRRANPPDQDANGPRRNPGPGQGRARRGYRGGRGRRRPDNRPDNQPPANNVPPAAPEPAPASNRANQFRLAQQSFKTNRKDCARRILKGQAFTGAKANLPPGTAEFWTNMFGTQSPEEGNSQSANPEELFEDIGRPISPDDVQKHALGPGDSAAGPDRITKATLQRVGKVKLAFIYNCLLMLGTPGTELAKGRTTLIPKKDNPTTPSDFRPITITSHITRGLHKILADRMGQTIPLSKRQKGFVKGINGCAGNTALLHALIKKAKQDKNREGVAIVFLDCAKAFDSVSHDAIRKAAAEKGLPPLLVKYITNLYSLASTTVAGVETPNRRGVLQGDPLSSHLFNFVLDLALKKLTEALGKEIGGNRICFIAFADDLVLVGKDPESLQKLLDELSHALRPSGLTFGLVKCASMTIKKGRTCSAYCDVNQVYTIGGAPLRAMGPTDLYEYLGMPTGYTGMPNGQDAIRQLEDYVSKLEGAPLKPQQKVWILQNVIVGKLRYQLALSNVVKETLRRVDRILRSALRKIVKLPLDVPNSLLHAPTGNGGLALASFVKAMPIAKISQLRSFEESQDPALLWLVADTTFLPGKAILPPREDGLPRVTIQTMKSRARRATVEDARASVAGKGLVEANSRNCPSDWVTSGNLVNKGHQYIGAIKTRMGAIPSRARVLRGRGGDRNCKFACRLPESNNHVLQACVRTYQPRNARHDKVLDLVVKACEDAGYQVAREPLIEAEENRRPDVVLYNEEDRKLWVLDAQIVSDAPGAREEEALVARPPGNRRSYLDSCHQRKVDKYATRLLIEAVRRDYLDVQPKFGSITVNNRGVIAPATISALSMILPAPVLKPLLRLISLRTLELSWGIWKHFNQSAG